MSTPTDANSFPTPPRHQRPTTLKKFLFGAPYYPEHWQAEDRKLDGERMRNAGVNVVRMAEFAWDVIEPSRENFDFTLFDETIATLGKQGIETILCTPTATPPRWLTADKPDWMRVTSEGVRMEHGNRQHTCTNNPAFRAESRRITRAMAEHYRDNSLVTGWQTDNEFHCHYTACYCPSCRSGFQHWLEQKYGNIETLNEKWGNRFWAQTYDQFDQIELPRHGLYPAPGNPSHELDHSRYLSASITAFQAEQVAILREVNPTWWITHNGVFDKIDHWTFSEDLDFYAVDVYPGFAGVTADSYTWGALKHESCRYVSGGYIVPEQSTGPGGQLEYMHMTCEPGQMRLWAWQGIAHGADGILHFRWRTCRFGAEIYWNGVLDHDNVPRRRYEEFAQEGQELQKVGSQLLGSVKEVKIGLLCNYDSEEMFASQTNGFPGPEDQIKALFSTATRRHLPVGLLDPRDSFDGMEIIIMPTQLAEDPALTLKLEDFVSKGGCLLVTARSYTRSVDNHVLPLTSPAGLSPLLGIKREEEGRLISGMDTFQLEGCENTTIPAFGGYEILNLEGARTVATWQVGKPGRHPHYAQGKCGFSHNQVGSGHAFYLGSYINAENAGALYDILLATKPITPLATANELVEMSIRHRDDRRFLFLLNHTLETQIVSDLPSGTEILKDCPVQDQVTLEPFGVQVIALD
ncbi:beta-galactosidase [Kiritimatiellota bacterium B12222]|nr:beta-galactosidase [Kiritimatiellota bacterium B12222]